MTSGQVPSSSRSVLVVVHGGRAEARELAHSFCRTIAALGIHNRKSVV
jgi:hypothetical protein